VVVDVVADTMDDLDRQQGSRGVLAVGGRLPHREKHSAQRCVPRRSCIEPGRPNGQLELRNDLAGQAATRTLAALPVGGAAEAWESRGLSWRHAVLAAVVQRVVLHPCLPGRNAFDPSRIEVLWRT
jgi:hypothetical protein